MLRMDKSISKEAKMKRVNQVLKEVSFICVSIIRILLIILIIYIYGFKFNLDTRANVKIGIPGIVFFFS